MTESFLALRQEKHCRVPLEYEFQITANLEHENAEVEIITKLSGTSPFTHKVAKISCKLNY